MDAEKRIKEVFILTASHGRYLTQLNAVLKQSSNLLWVADELQQTPTRIVCGRSSVRHRDDTNLRYTVSRAAIIVPPVGLKFEGLYNRTPSRNFSFLLSRFSFYLNINFVYNVIHHLGTHTTSGRTFLIFWITHLITWFSQPPQMLRTQNKAQINLVLVAIERAL